jgi:hypothetical protein
VRGTPAQGLSLLNKTSPERVKGMNPSANGCGSMANALAITLRCQDAGAGDVVFETHQATDDANVVFVYESCAG